MGKPIAAVGGAVSTPVQSPTQSPTQSPVQQSPVQQSPVQSEPKTFWPPAYGWRLKALGGEMSGNNGWQSKWLEHGSAVAGSTPADSVAALKPKLDPRLVHPSGRAFR